MSVWNLALIAGGVAVYVAVASILAWILFYIDKQRATRREWRIPESTLLAAAFLGGSLGAKFGQRLFRHKTKKQPFAFLLNLIVVGHVLLLAAFVVFVLGWLISGGLDMAT